MATKKESESGIHVGVDVGKFKLDFFIHERGIHWQEDNSPQGIKSAPNAHCQPMQLGVKAFLPNASCQRKAQKGRYCCLHEKADYDVERDDPRQHSLGLLGELFSGLTPQSRVTSIVQFYNSGNATWIAHKGLLYDIFR